MLIKNKKKKTTIIKIRKITLSKNKKKDRFYYYSIFKEALSNIKNRNTIKEVEYLLYKEYREYIKGKIHFSNSIKVLINGWLKPSKKEMYHKEIKDTLKNIFFIVVIFTNYKGTYLGCPISDG